MPNGEEKIVHQQGTVPGLDTPFEVSKERLENFTGGNIDGFWNKVLSTKPTSGEQAKFYPLSSIDMSGKYNYYAPYRDTEESYARGQSTWDKIGNGLTKMGGLALGTFLEGTVGAVYGLGKWIEDGNFSSLYDNDFNRKIDNWNKELEAKFPHYYTHRELDSEWYEPSSWFTGNFLWDKVVKNLGFAAGAIASGGVYSAALKGIGLTGWLVRQGKAMELLAAMEETLPTASKANRLQAFTSTAENLALKYGYKPLGSVLQKSDRILTAAMATSGEASIEALNNLNEFRDNAISEYKKRYGVNPTGEALDKINNYAENVGNWSYGLNTALLTATNYIQLPKILGSSYKAEKAIANSIETQPLIRNAETGLYSSALPKAGVKKLLTKSKNVASLFFAPVEGFEEGAQYSIQRGTENYFDKKMSGEKANWLEDGLGYGVSKTLNTKEGMENIIIGGLSGGLMTMRANIKERGITGYGGEREKATQEALSALNKSTFKKQLQDYAESSKRAQASQERRAMFIRQGDILEAKEEEFDFTHDYLLPRVKYGKIDGVKQDLNMYKNLAITPDGLQQLKTEGIATPDDTQESFLSRIAAIEEHANTVDGLYKSLNIKYSGITNEKGERLYSDDVIDKLVYAAAKIKNYSSRSNTLSANLSANGINSSLILSDINEGKQPSVEKTREALDSINNNKNLTEDQKDDLKRELQDVLEIGLRKNKMIDEYNSIVKNPSKYQPFILSEEDLKSPTVKYGEKELELDKPYSLRDSFIRDGNSLILAPKLSILSKTLDGEYEVKLPSGRTTFMTPKELENYQLSELDNSSPTIEKALNDAIKDVFNVKKYENLKLTPEPSLQQSLAYINSLNNKELVDDILSRSQEKIKAEQERKEKERKELEALEKEKELKNRVFKDQKDKKTGIITATPTTEEMLNEAEPRKKAWSVVFSSTTSVSEDEIPDNQASPRLIKERNLLFNQAFFKNRADYKVIVITQNQEEKLGLKGLIESVAKDDTERNWTNTDIDNGTVLAIYTKSEKGTLYYIDENGNKLGKVGEPVDLDKLVISTLPSTSTTWRDGRSRFRKQDEDKAGTLSEQWKNHRKKFFGDDTYSVFDFAVSRGLPKYDSYQEDGETKLRENSPIGSLFPESEKDKVINTEGILNIAVTDSVTYNGVTYPTKLGRIYFQYQDRFAPLTNRQFTREEKDTIFRVLLEMADQAKQRKGIKGRYLNYLNGILYFGTPEDTQGNAKTPGRNQIWIDNKFFINFGTTGLRVAFIQDSLKNNKDAIYEFLDGAYNNINNAILRDEFHSPFEEFYIDENDLLQSKQWKNYQSFLLDRELPYLRTPVRQISKAVPNDRNFKQKYAILQGIEYTAKEEKKEEPKKTSPKKDRELPSPKSLTKVEFSDGYMEGYIENGKATVTKFVYKGEERPTDDPAKIAAREKMFIDEVEKGRNKKIEEVVPASKEQKPSTVSGSEKGVSFGLSEKKDDVYDAPVTVQGEKNDKGQWTSDRKFYIPFSIVEAANKNDKISGQTAKQIVDRGGYSTKELDRLLPEWRNMLPNTEQEPSTVTEQGKEEVEEIDTVKKVQERLNEDLDVTSKIVKDVYLNGLHYLQTEDKKYYVIPDSNAAGYGEVSAKEVTKEEIIKPFRTQAEWDKVRNRALIEGSKTKEIKIKRRKDEEYRTAKNFDVERMSTEEKADFARFVKEKLPQFTVVQMLNIIQATGNRQAWGMLSGSVLAYYQNAEKGTGYHEAFEGVWKYFLLPSEKSAILDEVSKREGAFIDRESGNPVSYSDATEKQLKEKLADEFADYKLGRKVTIGSRIRDFFDRIIKFFRTFLKGFKTNTNLTEDLFKKIERGGFAKYKLPSTFDTTLEYREVKGLTAAQTHGFVQDILANFMIELFNEGADMFELENYSRTDIIDNIRAIYSEKIDGISTMDQLPEGEKTFNDLVAKVKKILGAYSITFDEGGAVSINDENQNRVDYDSSAQKMMLDVRKTQPFAVKLLLATLYKTTDQLSSAGLPLAERGIVDNYQLLQPSRTTVTLLETALGSTSIDDMIDKFKRLASENTDYVRLVKRLGFDPKEGNDVSFQKLTPEKFRLLAGFWNSFNKQKPFVREMVMENDGVFLRDMHIGSTSRQVFSSWENNIRRNARNGNGIFLPYDKKEKQFKIDKDKLNEYRADIASKLKVRSLEELKFLNDIGVNFQKSVYDKMDTQQRDSFSNAISRILKYMDDKGGLKIVSSEITGIRGPLTVLSELYARITKPDAESTFLNGENKQQQVFIQPNYTSQFENIFNSVGTLDELKEALPYLNDVYTRNSEVLKLGGIYFNTDGTRTDVTLRNGYINAVTSEGRRKLMKDVELGDRLAIQINSILNSEDKRQGTYFISVPADASTEYAISLPNFISYKELLNTESSNAKILDRFYGYLEDEFNLAKEGRENANIKGKGKQLRFFASILSPKLVERIHNLIKEDGELSAINRVDIDNDILSFIDTKISATKRNLENTSVISEVNLNTYAFPTLLSSYAESNDIKVDNISKEEIDRIIKQFWLNNFIAQTELHKVLFGDPFNFAIKGKVLDETKRIKSFLSPAQPTLTSKYYNNLYNDIFNVANGVTLSSPELGRYNFRNYVTSAVIKEVEIVGSIIGERPEYKGIKEADAQAAHTIEMHRDLKNRHYKWGKKEEEWYQFEKAYERLRRNLKGQLPTENYPLALKSADEKLIGWNGETYTKPKPEIFLNVEKPIVRGVKNGKQYIDPVLDKFSSAPLFYSAVEGTSLEDVYLQMQKEGVDYVILESGRKVGAENYRNFYNQDGSLNRLPFNNKTDIKWEDYYIQQENVYDEQGLQTRGSQITKLFSLDFFSGGEPLDGDTEIAEKAAYNDLLMNALTVDGYNRVLNRLGLVDNGTYFSFKGTTEGREKLMDTLRKESYKRDMPDNIRDIFERNPETGTYDIPFEATSEYTKIQKILYSLADKDILTHYYNGGQRTQMSVLGWENRLKGRNIVLKEENNGNISYRKISRKEYEELSDDQKKNVHLTSSRLKFYSKDDRYMEILLPNWFRRKMDPSNRMSDKELMEFLNKSEEGKRILRGVGFRIPTQATAQIEAFRVAGFLAPEMGDTVVVPSEITTKAGSDFDIDKLNTYLKNVYVDKNGIPHLIELYKIDTNNEDQLKDFYEKNILTKYKIFKEREKLTSSELSVDDLFKLLGFDPDTDEITNNLENKYVPSLDEFIAENKGADMMELNKKYHRFYRQALENEYIENLEWFITHPKNYDRLVTPTEEGDLKPLAAEIAKLTEGEESEDMTRLLDINYLAATRNAFVSAKKWIGIVVNGITSHAQAQRTNIYIDFKDVQLSIKDREILKDGKILLPHNADEEGRPTISVLKNKSGKYISDILSWFCTAMVDVAKDPYITKIIHNRKLVPVFTFMTRVGVPVRMLSYFMNQPIIREYMKFSDEMGFSKVANEYWRDMFLSHNMFPTSKVAKTLEPSKFKDTIAKFYDGTPLTDEENQHQRLVLDEFLKYFRMSEFLFNFTQATNWDTADFKTSGSIYKKQIVEQRENKNNIFKSPKKLVDSTFLRTMANSMTLMRDAIGVLSRFDNAEVRNELDGILKPFVSLTSYQSSDTLEKIDNGIVSGFIDYLIQVNRGLNRAIPDILIEESTSVAGMVDRIKKDEATLARYNNNPIFNYLKAQISNFERGGDNLVLRPFPKQVYDKDLITDSLRELRELSLSDNGKVDRKSLYSGLIRLALLQGTGSASNLLPYIPSEDFAAAIMPLIGTNLKEQAKAYKENKNYERNKWTDNDVVPEFTPVILAYQQLGSSEIDYKTDINFPFAEWNGKVLQISDTFNSREVEYPLLKVVRAPQVRKSSSRYDFLTNRLLRREGPVDGYNVKALAAKGDFSYLHHIGYQKVMLPNGEPLTKTVEQRGKWMTFYYYKQVNLMGDRNIQEHYTDQRPSVLDNQTVKIAQEDIIPDQVIIDRVQGKRGPDKGSQPVAPAPKTPTPSPEKVVPSQTKTEPKQEFPKITEVKKIGKKEKFKTKYKTSEGVQENEVEGYKIIIKEYPDFEGFIYKDDNGYWTIVEETTGMGIGINEKTIKEALPKAVEKLNKVFEEGKNAEILGKIGLFTVQKNKEKLGFKKGPCK